MTMQNRPDRGQKPVQISLRCFADNDAHRHWTYQEKSYSNHSSNNSTILVFSSQTTQDQYQRLVIGSCGIWTNGKLQKLCLFYDESTKQHQIDKIKSYASEMKLQDNCTIHVMSRNEFVSKIFFPYVYHSRTKCIAFDLPFEISRLAIHHGKARNMQKGFSFKLSENLFYPNIRIKNINGNASFVQFATPIRKKSERKRQAYRGFFVDVKILNYCLTNEPCDGVFEAANIKNKISQSKPNVLHEILQHTINKTITTYQLYQKLIQQFTDIFLLPEEYANKMYSPASIAKEILKKLDIKPFLQKNPNFPKEILGFLMPSYYGGRTEVRIRKRPVKVSYLDFTSMYPTMFVLMKMNQFLTSDKILFEHTAKKTQELLDKITPEYVPNRKLWGHITTICKIKPDNDILPIRSDFGRGNAQNIGLNHLKSTDDTALWYTLPDLIASKLLIGKTPTIVDAITFAPKKIQEFSNDNMEIIKGVTVNPAKDDFIKKIIEKRLELKTKNNSSNIQKILKIIANAASYGIYIQTNSENRQSNNTVYGLESFDCKSDKTEYPSKHFHPIIATFLTAGARLILAAAECMVLRNGGYLAYCDTDSVMVSPRHVKLVQDFFSKLNPYDFKTEMFKIETNENKTILHDVWFYGISSKRYVLYDKKENNKFQIHKYSLHGLGHLLGIDQKQWWKNILKLHYNPDCIITEYGRKYALSKLVITTPQMLDRLSRHIKKKIRPFNKVLIGTANRVDLDTGKHIIPMVQYLSPDRLNQAQFMPFVDYNSGKKYPNNGSFESEFYWKPLSDTFADYCNHPESKSSGDTGWLKRLKIRISNPSIKYIGKESHNLDETNTTGINSESYAVYEDIAKKIIAIKPCDAWKIGVSRSNLILLQKKIKQKDFLNLHHSTLQKIADRPKLVSTSHKSKLDKKEMIAAA